MESLLQLPLPARQAIVFVVGVLLGKAVNWAIYRRSYSRWAIGPWCSAPGNCTRTWQHWLPIVGWYFMRAEGGLDDDHSRRFWVRPLLLELSLGLGLAFLYRWEVSGSMLPRGGELVADRFQAMLHLQFAAHACLVTFLVAASFIDFDEQAIPDSITIPGTLLALIAATFIPLMRLPELTVLDRLSVLNMTSPHEWSMELQGVRGLGIAIFCFGGWCLALLPKVTTTQFGWWRGFLLMIASMVRPPRKTEKMVSAKRPFRRDHRSLMWLIGVQWLGWVWILAAWRFCSAGQWECLLSQLIGMAVGGAMIWSIRIVGKLALGREAMGFGDVTLMAMIGAFVGWQPCLIIFGLAPASAVIVALLQLMITRDTEIAFGPYLALGTILTVVGWHRLWFNYARIYFEIGNGWFVPGVCCVCLVLMAGMLWMIRLFKELVLGVEDDGENGALPEPKA